MKKIGKIVFGLFLFSFHGNAQADLKSNEDAGNTIYKFRVTDINGDVFDFGELKGKKILIVNTASKCGLTPQYKELEELYKKYKGQNFVIVGFPSNDFAEQEPGTNKEIGEFCKKNYGVSFPMMGKVAVKGDEIIDLYQFLTQKKKNGYMDSEVKWNFQKYLINEKGVLEKVVDPQVTPMSKEITNWIKGKEGDKGSDDSSGSRSKG